MCCSEDCVHVSTSFAISCCSDAGVLEDPCHRCLRLVNMRSGAHNIQPSRSCTLACKRPAFVAMVVAVQIAGCFFCCCASCLPAGTATAQQLNFAGLGSMFSVALSAHPSGTAYAHTRCCCDAVGVLVDCQPIQHCHTHQVVAYPIASTPVFDKGIPPLVGSPDVLLLQRTKAGQGTCPAQA